jgi:hypothetical protein
MVTESTNEALRIGVKNLDFGLFFDFGLFCLNYYGTLIALPLAFNVLRVLF